MEETVLCSHCFNDQGLRLDAERIGIESNNKCPNCESERGRKLDEPRIEHLAHRFFVWGTFNRPLYGGAPIVQFNQHQTTEIEVSEWLKDDVELISRCLGIGFFYYGPRFWMIGEVEPLKDLQNPKNRGPVIDRIIGEYPQEILCPGDVFYRVRTNIDEPSLLDKYDSPPLHLAGSGRLDSKDFPVMYTSQDLTTCVHECRITAEDELFVATLSPTRDLKLLNLAELIDDDSTEFESLDMAVHMLFLAGEHSYGISREVAIAIKSAGFDGLYYPSYFSLLRTGAMPFETTYGISHRRISQLQDYERSKIVPNIALFGRPIEDRIVRSKCINKLIVSHVDYGFHFGPVEF